MGIPNGRNYGIDLLRIVSMFMVVILHTLGHGGLLNAADPASLNYKAAWLLESAAYCAVNCFALVSGYVGYRSRFKLSNIAALWLQVAFFNVVFALLEARTVELTLILKALQPVRHNAYWYYTAYFGISFLIPLVNAAVEHLDRRTLIVSCAGLVLLYTVYPTWEKQEIFGISGGYHAMWLLILCYFGACIQKLDPFPKWGKGVWLLVYGGAVLVSWGVLLLNNHLKEAMPDRGLQLLNLIRYTSPTILLAAFALVMLFSRIKCGAGAQKLITLIAPLTFGVYLIHDSLFIRSTLIKGRLAAVADSSLPVMLLNIIGFPAAVFAGCLVIEYLRSRLFQWLRIKQLLDKAETAIFRK